MSKQEKVAEREYEDQITRSIAETFHFTVDEKYLRCKHCKVRYGKHYIGDNNQRMIQHARTHGIKGGI